MADSAEPVESAARWFRSSHCETDGCIEVRFGDGEIEVRSSHGIQGQELRFSRAEWMAFLDGARRREFDLPSGQLLGQSGNEGG